MEFTLEEKRKQVEEILINSQDYPFKLDCTNLIKQWYDAKQQWIKLFQNKTIVRSAAPVRVLLSPEQKEARFNEFLFSLAEDEVLTPDLETFLRENQSTFFDNKVNTPFPKFNIKSGQKISKSIKHFLSDTELIRWVQDKASFYIQENKIEGYLYISVDPIDFLTISENDENWWSCHSLDKDYRAGNLSYMVDQGTAVVYLADANRKHFKCLPEGMDWYSKKWRMLIHTDFFNNIYFDKQYPYTNRELLAITYNELIKHSTLFSQFTPPQDYGFKQITFTWSSGILNPNQLYLGGRVFSTEDIIDTSDYLGYCDLKYSSSYAPIVMIKEDSIDSYLELLRLRNPDIEEEFVEFKNILYNKIGEKAICPCCGKNFISSHYSFLCDECIAENDADEPFYLQCECCGRHIYSEEEPYYTLDGKFYCNDCYEEVTI